MKITDIKFNPTNPRIIKDSRFKELVQSIKDFPDMLDLRPIVIDEKNMVLGGNMRLKACIEAGLAEVPVTKAHLSEEQKKEFIIKDNVGYGEWDWETLANGWDVASIKNWGVNVPSIKDTELLSGLDYKPLYYEPEHEPHINLEDCIDLTKFNEKIKALEEYKLTKQQKKILMMFAYRFIKIDFESVANYHAFNASEQEKKAIERLRLVLTDDGKDGFIEDDLLRLLGFTDQEFF
jgi:hypothetical protein